MTIAQALPQAARLLATTLSQLHNAVAWGYLEQLGCRAAFCPSNGTLVEQHVVPWPSAVHCRCYSSATQHSAQIVCNYCGAQPRIDHASRQPHPATMSTPGSSTTPLRMAGPRSAAFSTAAVSHDTSKDKSRSGFPTGSYSQPQFADLPEQHPAQVSRVLDGKAVAAEWSAELEQGVPELTAALGRPPGLAVVLVGNRPDSMLYVSRKEEACQRVGINCQVLHLSDSISQSELQDAVKQVAADPAVDGLLVQLPLPRHLDEERVMEFLDPRKDVDGFHPLNMGRMLMRGRARRFVPATPLGVVELLSRSSVSIAGKTAVVLGDSNIVGTPLAALLRDEGAALVTTCHRVSYQEWYDQSASRARRAQAEVCLPRLPGPAPAALAHRQHFSKTGAGVSNSSSTNSSKFQAFQLPRICRTADILVVAVGSPELVKRDWVKPGAVVVDVGINVVPLSSHDSMIGPSQLPQQQLQQLQQQQQQHWEAPQDIAGGKHSSGSGDGTRECCQQHTGFQVAQGSMSESECNSNTSSGSSSIGVGGSSYGLCSGSYRVVGDVAHDEVADVASVLTPVPGGVGPMTIAAVLHNTLQAARYTAGLLPW